MTSPGAVTIADGQWLAAVDVLSATSDVALACHVGPDGDALGSMLALGIGLRARGCTVTASWGSDPFAIPRQYTFLPGLDLLSPPDAVPAAPGVMVTFDAGSIDRLGSLADAAQAASTLIVVDHHASNDSFGTINLVEPSAAASAILVHELLGRLGIEVDADMATCLYVGLVTDTGRFQYANTTPYVMNVAADLLARGAPHADIARVIYDTHSLGYLKVAAIALERLRVIDEASLVWTWVTQDDLVAHGLELEDTEALIDLVRSVDITDVAAILKQQPDGRFRVSMRSKGGANVGEVCASFDGGGHALAAGFTTAGTDADAAIKEIAAALRT